MPGREHQKQVLANLVRRGKHVPSAYLFGLPATGKRYPSLVLHTSNVNKQKHSTLTRKVLEDSKAIHAIIDCMSVFTVAQLFDTCLEALLNCENGDACVESDLNWKCDNAADFAFEVKMRFAKQGHNQHRFLVLDNADALRAFPNSSTLIQSLLRVADMSGANITVMLISCLDWVRFKESAQCIDPALFLYFPAYTRAETKAILALDAPTIPTRIESNDDEELSPEEEQALYLQFVDLAIQVLHQPCRDLNELRHLVALLFSKYKEPIMRGKYEKKDTGKLYAHIQFYFKEVIDKLYIRKISSSEWSQTNVSVRTSFANGPTVSQPDATDVDLPHNTAYLLLASFIASYNPKGLDVRFFARASEKRTRKTASKLKKTSSTKLRQQLVGPKTFPIERMLAIFYRIKEDTQVDEEMESLVDIQMQIKSLISKGLLLRMSQVSRLEEVKCKVNIGLETAYALAGRMRFDLSKYLHDFKA
ncbi:Origin recognition complex subunit 5 [Chytriomyces hyalinus]|nr:Origin recognition complex subunit 5 [Chytriomyces hyalinus]